MEKIRKRILDELSQPQNSVTDTPAMAATAGSPSPQNSDAGGSNIEANTPASTTAMRAPDATPLLSANWTENGLLNSSENFSAIHRFSALAPAKEVLAVIKDHEARGLPLIIERWHEHPRWNAELFTVEGFVGDDGGRIVDARNVRTSEDVKMPLWELVQNYQVISKSAKPDEKERFYGKDIECPESWNEWLESGPLPTHIHPFGKDDMFSHLPLDERPETLMCYLGIGDTFTPAHKDLCGSFGHNIMCYTADGGSAFWFMTATGPPDEDGPAMYFKEKLGEELDLESHQATVQELRNAPFKVYIAEQRLGDLILVPPRSCHQVVNRGGITIKMSWSRMGLKSFQLSLFNELPIYHRVCRPEIYRVKLNIFHAVKAYGRLLSDHSSATASPSSSSSYLDIRLPVSSCRDSTESDQIAKEPSPLSLPLTEAASTFKSLLRLLDDILVQEWNSEHMHMKHLEVPELRTCDFCGADIFQSFFMCKECTGGEEGSEFVCCTACYVEGRSCACEGRHMEPFQTRPFDDLIRERNNAAMALNTKNPPCSSRTLNTSSGFRLFEAACKLRQHKIDRAEKSNGKINRRCTTRVETIPSHDALTTHVLYCDQCHANLCFLHILNIHGVHASEAMLLHAQDHDQAAWHHRHTKAAKRKGPPSEHSKSGGLPDLMKRMTWAASKFRTCRPIDTKRGKEGFYDEIKLVTFTEVGAGEAQNIDETSVAVSLPNTCAQKGDKVVIFNLRSDSPLTELSEGEMDLGSSSSDESSPPSSPIPTKARKRRPPPTRPGIMVQRPRTTAKNTVIKTGQMSSPRQVFDCVLVPSSPRKRPAAQDSAVSTTPAKRARADLPPEAPIAGPSSSSPPRNPRAPAPTTASGTLPINAFRQRTLVPVALSPDPSTVVAPGRSRPKRAVAIASSAESPSGIRLEKFPLGARIGPPKRNARRAVPSSRESSAERPAPVAASTSKRMHSSRSIAKKAPTKVLPEAARDQLGEPSNVFMLHLETSRAREAALKREIKALKRNATFRQASVARAQIDKLEDNIDRLKAEVDKLERELQQSQRQDEENTRLAERRVADSTDEVERLQRDVDYRDERLESLQLQVEQSRAELDRRRDDSTEEARRLQRDMDDRNETIRSLQLAVEESRTSRAELERSAADLTEEARRLQRVVDDREETIKSLQLDLEQNRAARAERNRSDPDSTDEVKRLQRAVDEREERIKALQHQIDQTRTDRAELDRNMNGFVNIVGLLGQGLGAMVQNASLSAQVRNQQPNPAPSYGVPQAEPQVFFVQPRAGPSGLGRHRSAQAWNNQGRTNRASFAASTHSTNGRQSYYQTRREDDFVSRRQFTRSIPPREPRAMGARNIGYERQGHEEGPSFRDDRSESRTYGPDDREGSFHRYTQDDLNVHSGTQSSSYRLRGRNGGRSRSHSRAAATPPQPTHSRSASPQRRDPRRNWDPTPDTTGFSETSQASHSNHPPVQDQDLFVDCDHISHDRERRYRSEPPMMQESEQGDDDQRATLSTWDKNALTNG